MPKTDYSALRSAIEENGYEYVSSMNENIAEMIIRLKTEGFWIKENEKEKWQDMLELCRDNSELKTALIKTPLPESFIKDLYKELKYFEKEFVFANPNLSREMLEFAIDNMGTGKVREQLIYNSGLFHNHTLELLSELDIKTQEKLDFEHFSLVFPNVDLQRKIYQILNEEDKSWFGEEIPEKFNTAIINNKNIDEKLRFAAFQKSYDPKNIREVTHDIAQNIYTAYADVMFDVYGEFKDTDAQRRADDGIHTLVSQNQLPVSCHIDFIERYVNNPQYHLSKSLFKIIDTTPQNYVLQESLKLSNPRTQLVSTNENVNCDTFRVLMSVENIDKLQWGFAKMAMRRYVDLDIAEEFIALGNEDMNAILTASYFSGEKLAKTVVDSTKDESLKRALSAIYDMRNTLFEECSRYHGIQIMNHITENIFSYRIPGIKHGDLNDILNTRNNSWSRVTNKEYEIIKQKMEEMKKKYPEFERTWDFISKRNENIHQNEKLYHKYPEVFNNRAILGIMPDKEVSYNIDNLVNLSQSKIDELSNDISTLENGFIIYQFKLKILSHFDDIETYNADDLYVSLYKLSGLYDAIENQQQKIMRDQHKREMEVEENVR